MLRKDLYDSDIPGRTTVTNRIKQAFQEHLNMLRDNMKVCIVHFSRLICLSKCRIPLAKSHLLAICGLIQIFRHLWR